MVMLGQFRVEAGCRARVAGLGHQPEGHESAQDAMDRHAGDLGQLAPDLAVELFRGGMIDTIEDRLKDGAALGGDGQTTFAVGCEEAVHALGFASRADGHEDNCINQMIKIGK